MTAGKAPQAILRVMPNSLSESDSEGTYSIIPGPYITYNLWGGGGRTVQVSRVTTRVNNKLSLPLHYQTAVTKKTASAIPS